MPRNLSIVLGISLAHGDSSAALIIDGCLVAAAEEERFTRIKHYALFPTKSIEYCLRHAGLTPRDVQIVAIAKKPWNGITRRIRTIFQHPQFLTQHKNPDPHSPQESLRSALKRVGLGKASLARVEHHYAHMMSVSHMTSGEEAAFLSFDGLGDFVSTAIGHSTGNGLEILDRVYFPHSVGFFYTAMTQFLGFQHFGDEFKVMGLSSYGQPRYLTAMHELIRESEKFGFHLNLEAFPTENHISSFQVVKAQPKIRPFYNNNFLTQVIGVAPRKPLEALTRSHWDLAKSVQARFEEIGYHLLGQLHDRVGKTTVALSGGCAHNSVWVGKIPQNTPYKKVVVAPACSDAGIAVGAAITVCGVQVNPEGRHWALLGPNDEDYTLDSAPALPSDINDRTFNSDEQLIRWMVEELCEEKIIGLFRGRMEFGPRALGSRSIIADPRVRTMRDRLNERVKHRESFRPFAASVLWEYQEEWFENSFFSPSMEAVFPVKELNRPKISGVVHVDHSCRIQSVVRDTQPFFWDLIEAFRKKTGVPMLINTSFNDSEPVVCTPQDALNCFANCDMDHLVLGLRVFSRLRQATSLSA